MSGLGSLDLVVICVIGAAVATELDNIRDAIKDNTAAQQRLASFHPSVEIKAENVIGSDTPDVFYDVTDAEGKTGRCYLKIDGKDVKQGYCLP